MANQGNQPRNITRAATAQTPLAANLSRTVEIADVPDGGLPVRVEANRDECAAIADKAGLVAVNALAADLTVEKQSETRFAVFGPLTARVTQTCGVSLDPFESDVQAEVEADFVVPARKNRSRRGRAGTDGDREVEQPGPFAQIDAAEPVVDGRIDIGALVEEFLILSLDPYPRKPGVRFEGPADPAAEDAAGSPFAVLKNLKGDA